MASLLYPDDDQSQWPTTSGGLLTPPDDRPAVLQPDPRADALGQTYQDISDYMARQQAQSVAQGYWTGGGLLEGGHPTGKGLLDAIGQMGTAVALGTSAPGDAPPPGFTAYHGSPHDFSAFDLSKIGTGEGAQAYGHGLYLADAEALAQFYRKKLAGPRPDYTGEIAPELRSALRDEDYLGFDTPGQALQAIRAHPDWATRWDVQNPNTLTPLLEAHDAAKYGGQGHMYEVQVNADPAHFLDWDKPLSEQHPVVQGAINSIADNSVALSQRMVEAARNNISLTGNDVVSTLARSGDFGDPRIARALQQAGIPGIRYLDAGSRGAGEGSRNTVVFSPEIMEIIRKYGLAGLMAGGMGAAGLSGQQRQQQ